MEKRIALIFKKYLSNACTPEELDELFQYIRASGDDETLRQLIRETYEEIRNASESYVDHMGELVIPAGQETEPVFLQEVRPSHKTLHKVLAGACLISIISVGILFLRPAPARPVSRASLSALRKSITERAEYKYLLLPDSTQVWLNAGSLLEYPDHFGKGNREVTLSGEAYFDVKHAAEHPFLIHTRQILTTVMGTAFNINAYPERTNITVSVSRGKVKVSRGTKLVAMLLKGQQVRVDDADSTVIEKNIAVNTVAGWQQGNLIYEDEPLQNIIADLQRVYSASIQISDTNIRQLKISTRFRREQGISQALEILCKLTDTQLYQRDSTYIIQ